MPDVDLIHGDCLEVLHTLDAASVDAVVTDPPSGINFMAKAWDSDRGGRDAWVAWLAERLAECLRVAKPGSVLLCWSIPRTSHWTGTAIEDAGWLIEDRIAHHFGSGFPKHRSKLKPATEDWWLARKPGVKWLGVAACRVGTSRDVPGGKTSNTRSVFGGFKAGRDEAAAHDTNVGRWPPNLVLSHSPDCNGVCAEGCPVRLLGEQSGERKDDWARGSKRPGCFQQGVKETYPSVSYGGGGTAARFFPQFDADPFLYAAKASRAERNRGCEGMEEKRGDLFGDDPYTVRRNGDGKMTNGDGTVTPQANHHPTVKPLALMRWLCRLACPPGGMILDPFMGSGSTGVAAVQEGFGFIGIEREPEYHEIARRRIEAAQTVTLPGLA